MRPKPDNSSKSVKFNRFLHYAIKASEAEQKFRYEEAQDYWEIAKLSAKNNDNRTWAENRAAFCKKMNKPIEFE